MATADFWSGKRVCVTGDAGFLGSYVVELLGRRGCESVFAPRRADYDLADAMPSVVSMPTRATPTRTPGAS